MICFEKILFWLLSLKDNYCKQHLIRDKYEKNCSSTAKHSCAFSVGCYLVRFPPTVLFIGCGYILLLLTFKWHDFLSLREDVYKWADVGRVAFCPAQLEGRLLLQSLLDPPQCPFPAQSQLFFPQGELFPLGRELLLGISVILKGLDHPSFSVFPQPVSGFHVLFCLLICELESEKFVPSFTGCFSESFAEVLFSEESLWQSQGRAVFW